MCKRLWQWLSNQEDSSEYPIHEPLPGGKKRIALLFGINIYPGSANELQGCINDINDVEVKLKVEFPDFIIQKYKDSQVTCENFYNVIKDTILSLVAGDHLYIHYSGHGTQVPSNSETNGYHEALYLYNGPFIDDQFQSLVVMLREGVTMTAKFDSCFSGDMLRNSKKSFKRFYAMPGVPIRHRAIRKFGKKIVTDNCVVFSGCSEDQTSADAYINGRYNGAFSYYDNRAFNAQSTYMDEIDRLHAFLPSAVYSQNPTMDGDSSLFDKKVFT